MEQLVSLYTCASRLNIVSTAYVFIELMVQRINKHFNLPIPTLMITTSICIILGTILYCVGAYKSADYEGISFLPAETIFFHFMPIYIITTLYNMDILLYTKSLRPVCILFLSVMAATAGLVVIAMHYVLHPQWEWSEAILASLVVLPVQPTHALGYLQDMSKYSRIARILHVESIGTFMLIHIAFEYTRMIRSELISTSSHHYLFIAKFIIGGCGIGVVTGRVTACCINILYNKSSIVLALLMGTTSFVYFTCECVLHVSGDIAIIILATHLVMVRHKFTTEVDRNITICFQSINLIAEVTVLCLYVTESLPYFWSYLNSASISSAMLLYITLACARVCSYLLFGFFTKMPSVHLEYNTRVSFILGLNGLKGSFNLILCFMLMIDMHAYVIGRMIVVEMVLVYIFTMFFNALPMQLLLSIIGMENLTSTRRQNMNYCLKFMVHAKDVMIATLKLFNYLADAQWTIIRNSTDLRHPYTGKIINQQTIENTGINYGILPVSTTMCPRCFKRVYYDLSVRDVMSFCSVARTRLLRAKQVSINDQYANDAIDISTWHLISYFIDHIRFSLDNRAKIKIKSYLKPPKVTMYFRKRIEALLVKRLTPPPRNNCGRLFFYLTNHIIYDCILFTLVVIVIVFSSPEFTEPMTSTFAYIYIALAAVFGIDFLLRLFGYNSLYSSLRSYCLILSLSLLSLEICFLCQVMTTTGYAKLAFSICTRIMAICRIIYILISSRYLLVTLSNLLDENIDDTVTFGFQVATSLAFCCEENLDNLNKIFDVAIIRQIYALDVQKEMVYLHSLIRHLEMERPWITITMKTKQLVKTTLNHLQGCLLDLHLRGFIDNIEYNFIHRKILDRLKALRKIKTVEPAKAKDIFNEIPWLSGNAEITKYLYEKAKRIYFDPGDVVIKEEQKPSGIYIVISGRLKMYYKHSEARSRQMAKRGQIPNVDYLSTTDFETDIHDDLMPGSTFGERGVLTHRRYDCTIIADDRVQAFMIANEIMQDAFVTYNHPVTGLEATMWKYCYIHLAIAIMRDAPIYKSMHKKDIKLKLDRAFVPSLRCYKMFKIMDQMEDILLIEGIAIDTVTKRTYSAPALIPRNLRKMYISKSPYVGIAAGADTKLMIIPLPGISEVDMMLDEEDVADIVSFTTTTCVLHSGYELTQRAQMRKKNVSADTLPLPSSSSSIEVSRPFSSQSDKSLETDN